MRGRSLILLIILLLFLPYVFSESNSIYRSGNSVFYEFENDPHLKIIKQTGFEKQLDLKWSLVSGNTYQIEVCHKDFTKNKNKEGIDKVKIKKIKKKNALSSNYDSTINLKNKECQTVDIDLLVGDVIKIGDQSVEITLEGDNVTFSITPEYKECSYLKCESDIFITNNGDSPINLISSDLSALASCKNSWIETIEEYVTEQNTYNCNETFDCWINGSINVTQERWSNIDKDFEVTINPSETKQYILYMVFEEEQTEYKYNVSLFYNNQTHIIDPFFNTTYSTFNNGVYNHTYLNASGFVQLNQTYNYGEYYSEIVDTGVESSIKSITWKEDANYWNQYKPTANTVILCSFNGTTNCEKGNMAGKVVLNVSYKKGKFETQGVHINGTDRLSYSSTGLNVNTGTISFWQKADSDYWNDGVSHTLFQYYVSTANYITIGKNSVGKLLMIYRGNGVTKIYSGDVSDTFGTNWHFFTLTWNSVTSSVKAYVDGKELSGMTSGFTPIVGSNPLLNIGSTYTYSSRANGTYEEFILSNKVFSATDVKRMYKRGTQKLNFSIRGCDDALCSGESFTGNYNQNTTNINSPPNRYSQYKAMFESLDQTYTPQLFSVSLYYENCIPDWVQSNSCEINDTTIISYIDHNNCSSGYGLPVDNGTELSCNYCSQSLEKNYTSDCYLVGEIGMIDYQMIDNNYYSCCAITGLLSDCSILYDPYNETQSETCIYTKQEFELYIDDELYFGFGVGGLKSDKVFGKIYMNGTNESFTCISYVKTVTDNILQTNPPYTKRTESTITIIPKEIEDREFFFTDNGLANIYWTDHNLILDGRQYIFGVECSSGSQRLISEKVATVFHKDLDRPITRFFWIENNILPIIFILLFLIVLLAFIGYKNKG